MHSADFHRHSSAAAVPVVSVFYVLFGFSAFALVTLTLFFLIKRINFHCFRTCLKVIAGRLMVMIFFFFYFLFGAAALSFLSRFPFSSNVSKIMLFCDFLYSYLVYSHKKQKYNMLYYPVYTKGPCNSKEVSQDRPCFTAHSPNKWKKKQKNNNNNNNGGGGELPAEQQFLWSNHFFMVPQSGIWAKGISWQTGRGNETKELGSVGCLHCCIFLPGEQQHWRTAGD